MQNNPCETLFYVIFIVLTILFQNKAQHEKDEINSSFSCQISSVLFLLEISII